LYFVVSFWQAYYQQHVSFKCVQLNGTGSIDMKIDNTCVEQLYMKDIFVCKALNFECAHERCSFTV